MDRMFYIYGEPYQGGPVSARHVPVGTEIEFDGRTAFVAEIGTMGSVRVCSDLKKYYPLDTSTFWWINALKQVTPIL